MAAPGGGFAESYANVGHPGNTCKETRSAVQPMRSHAGQRFVATAQRPAAAGKDEVRPIGDAAETAARGRSGRRFRSALERKRDDAETGAHDAASAAAMAGWFRSESAAAPAGKTTAVSGPSGASAARAVDRILVGSGPDGAQARIRIGSGALAGTGDPAVERRRRACRRGAALDTRGDFAADAVIGDGRDQVAASGQGHRSVHDGVRRTLGRAARRRRGSRRRRRRRPRRNGRGPAGERAGVRPGDLSARRALVRRAPRARRCGRARRCRRSGRSGCRRSDRRP